MMTVSFKTSNAAFEDEGKDLETARLLKEIAGKIERGQTEGPVMDGNGNRIGKWQFR